MENRGSRLNSLNITSPLIGSRLVAGSPAHYTPSPALGSYPYTYPHRAAYPYATGLATTTPAPLAYSSHSNHSRVEYVPYQKTRIQYQPKEYVDQVPVERTVIEYQEVKKVDYVPRERTVIDYYPVEHQISYVPQTIPEKHIDYVPVESINHRIEYIPYERQVVHYPNSYTETRPTINRSVTTDHALRRSHVGGFGTIGGNTYTTATGGNTYSSGAYRSSNVNIKQGATSGYTVDRSAVRP